MKLRLVFKKHLDKPNTLTIFREDGTSTWAGIHPGLETHDLAHFAVEQTLKMKEAFFGLISEGFEITDFELPNDQKPGRLMKLPFEALQSEHLVNLIQTEKQQKDKRIDLIIYLESIFETNGLPFIPELSKLLPQIRVLYHKLSEDWLSTKPKETLELMFELS